MTTTTNINYEDQSTSGTSNAQPAEPTSTQKEATFGSLLSALTQVQLNFGQLQEAIAESNLIKGQEADGEETFMTFAQLEGNALISQAQTALNNLHKALDEAAKVNRKRSILTKLIKASVVLGTALMAVSSGGTLSCALPLVFTAVTMIPAGNGSNIFEAAQDALGNCIGSKIGAAIILGVLMAAATGSVSKLAGQSLKVAGLVATQYGSQTLLAAGLPADLAECAKTQAGKLATQIISSAVLISVGIVALCYSVPSSAAEGENILTKFFNKFGKNIDPLKMKNFTLASETAIQLSGGIIQIALAKALIDASKFQYNIDGQQALISKYFSELGINNTTGQNLQDSITQILSGIIQEELSLTQYSGTALQKVAELTA